MRLGTVSIMLPVQVNRLTVQEAADRYVELVRAKTVTGALSPATAEVYARDVATFVRLAGPDRVLDDLTGEDVDAVLLAFARKPDERRKINGRGRPRGRARGRNRGRARRRRRGSAGRCRRCSGTPRRRAGCIWIRWRPPRCGRGSGAGCGPSGGR
ncbi:hypothetical protein GCM10027612_49900 [Microbispora bryophytorum subsp. camponoti]